MTLLFGAILIATLLLQWRTLLSTLGSCVLLRQLLGTVSFTFSMPPFPLILKDLSQLLLLYLLLNLSSTTPPPGNSTVCLSVCSHHSSHYSESSEHLSGHSSCFLSKPSFLQTDHVTDFISTSTISLPKTILHPTTSVTVKAPSE